MQSIIGLVILILDILAIIQVVKSAMTGGKKVLWIVLILILPVIGLILYYLIGKKSK